MPLCVISGVTSLNTIFYVGFCFMKSEFTEDYIWVLLQLKKLYNKLDLPDPDVILTDCEGALMRSIDDVFPGAVNITCIWHVNNNVKTNCNKSFDSNKAWEEFFHSWERIIYAKTEEEFNSQWEALQEAYNTTTPFAVTYLAERLIPRKRKFVAYWVDKYLYFGNRATSRGENNNGRIKRQLGTSTGKLTILCLGNILTKRSR